MLDYQALAEGSLGTEWAARTDAEKAQFTDLLKQLVRSAYEKQPEEDRPGFSVNYLSEDPAERRRAGQDRVEAQGRRARTRSRSTSR